MFSPNLKKKYREVIEMLYAEDFNAIAETMEEHLNQKLAFEKLAAKLTSDHSTSQSNPCTECNGEKELTFYRGDDEYVFPCPHCKGTGVDPNLPEER